MASAPSPHPAPALRYACADDAPRLKEVLRSHDLCCDDVDRWIDGFVVAEISNAIVGMAAVERHGQSALLRSVAVEAAYRGSGTARRLVESVLDRAQHQGVSDVYLLTTTARDYFARFGFAEVSRAVAPAEIRATKEFGEFCPSEATFMHLSLEKRAAGATQ